MKPDHPTPPEDHWLARQNIVSQDGIQATSGYGQNNTVIRQPAQPWVKRDDIQQGSIALPPPRGTTGIGTGLSSLWTDFFISIGVPMPPPTPPTPDPDTTTPDPDTTTPEPDTTTTPDPETTTTTATEMPSSTSSTTTTDSEPPIETTTTSTTTTTTEPP